MQLKLIFLYDMKNKKIIHYNHDISHLLGVDFHKKVAITNLIKDGIKALFETSNMGRAFFHYQKKQYVFDIDKIDHDILIFNGHQEQEDSCSIVNVTLNSHKLLRLLADNLPDMLWAKDVNGKYIFVNKAICNNLLMAKDTSEPVGKGDVFFAKRERKKHKENKDWHTFGELCLNSDEVVLKNMKNMIFEESGNVKGKPLYLEVHKAPFFDNKGRLLGTVGSGRDITNEIKIKRDLQLKEEFEIIFKSSKDGIAIFDLTSKFLEFNDAYLNMTGFTREELLAKSCIELTIPEDIEKSKEVMANVLKNGFVENFEKSCLVKDDRIIIINMTLSLMPDFKRVLVVTKNITQNKLLESQLKLESMTEMIVNIAHQWRQPLSVISTIASGISFKKEFAVLKEEEIIPSMDQIVEKITYLSHIIDNFSSFIKEEKEESKIDISSLFEKILSFVKLDLDNSDIEIITTIKSNVAIKGYENQLIRAIVNIINNSKDVLITNIALKEKYIFIDVKQIDNQCEIIIKDNGGGILSSVMNKIFEPYFTTKHQSQGAGLGLSHTHSIIAAMHKGSITASNTTYKYQDKEYTGACFTIRFQIFNEL